MATQESVKSGTELQAIRNKDGDVIGWTHRSAAVANGWHSRRYRSADAFREWQDDFAQEKADKLDRAKYRQEQRLARGDLEQLKLIEIRPGKSQKEAQRLNNLCAVIAEHALTGA